MNGHNWKLLVLRTVALGVVALGMMTPATVEAEWKAPNATLLFGGSVFNNGQSEHFGPALRHIIDEYWEPGPCTYDSSGHASPSCDILRMGLTMYADVDGAPTACAGGQRVNDRVLAAQEDGGGLIGDDVQSMHTLAGTLYCDQTASGWQFNPGDKALEVTREALFPEAFGSTQPVSSSVTQQWWERPNLVLTIVDGLPQTDDARYDGRLRNSLVQACRGFDGDGGKHPAVPTWVMVAPRHDNYTPLYAGVLAAAGGTAQCCWGPHGCDIDHDPPIDVCAQIQNRSEVDIRRDIVLGRYECSGSSQMSMTGALLTTNLPSVECQLAGQKCDSHWSPDPPTSLFDIMSCVQTRPKDIDPANFAVNYCWDGSLNCKVLTPGHGLEWVDDNKTLYIVHGLNDDGSSYCKALGEKTATLDDDPCPNQGNACDTGLAGRCGPGTIVCQNGQERCLQTYEAMPEVCNGLDDDCDGHVDNLSTSWDHFPQYDPTKLGNYDNDGINRTGIHCFERDVCECHGGTGSYGGHDYASYIESWQPGTCWCGEGLSAPASPAAPDDSSPPAPDTSTRAMSCAVGASTVSSVLGILSFLLLCLAVVLRSRQQSGARSSRY